MVSFKPRLSTVSSLGTSIHTSHTQHSVDCSLHSPEKHRNPTNKVHTRECRGPTLKEAQTPVKLLLVAHGGEVVFIVREDMCGLAMLD